MSQMDQKQFAADIRSKSHEEKQEILLRESQEVPKQMFTKAAAWVQRMPADNHCCFHALNCILGFEMTVSNALALRRRLLDALEASQGDASFHDVRRDLEFIGMTVPDYLRKMREPLNGSQCNADHWGGAIEIAIFVRLIDDIQVAVFEEQEGQYVALQVDPAPVPHQAWLAKFILSWLAWLAG